MKTKDFNLEEALAGATVVYGGNAWKLYFIKEKQGDKYFLVGTHRDIWFWLDEQNLVNDAKLLDETPIVERWVNVYWDGYTLWVTMHETKEEALSKNCGTYYLKTIRITNEKGGDDEK